MAFRFPAHETFSWQNAPPDWWSAADDDARNLPAPANGDSVAFTSLSAGGAGGSIYLNDHTAALAEFDAEAFKGRLTNEACAPFALVLDVDGPVLLGGDYEGILNGIVIEVVGNIEVCDGATFPGILTIEHNSTVAAAYTIKTRGLTENVHLVVSNNGITSLTVSEAAGEVIKWKSFDLQANAKYAGGVFAHHIGGNILIDNAVAIFTQADMFVMDGDGDVKCPNYQRLFTTLSRADGVTSTFTDDVYSKNLSGAGIIVLGANMLSLLPNANDFYTATCDYTVAGGKVQIRPTVDVSNADAIDLTGVDCEVLGWANDKTVTVAGRFSCAALTIYRNVDNQYTHLKANGGLTVTEIITLGLAGSAKVGELTVVGTCIFEGGLVCAGTSIAHGLHFTSSHLTLTGEIKGTNVAGGAIVATSDDGRIRGGTITDLDCTGRLWCQPQMVTDGTGNSGDVIFRPKPEGIGMGVAA